MEEALARLAPAERARFAENLTLYRDIEAGRVDPRAAQFMVERGWQSLFVTMRATSPTGGLIRLVRPLLRLFPRSSTANGETSKDTKGLRTLLESLRGRVRGGPPRK